jgi:hypothetical protein
LGEAEIFAAEGFDDILLAFPVIGEKNLALFQALAEKINIKTVVDSMEAAEGLSCVCDKVGRKIPVYIEVEGGFIAVDVSLVKILFVLRSRFRIFRESILWAFYPTLVRFIG